MPFGGKDGSERGRQGYIEDEVDGLEDCTGEPDDCPVCEDECDYSVPTDIRNVFDQYNE